MPFRAMKVWFSLNVIEVVYIRSEIYRNNLFSTHMGTIRVLLTSREPSSAGDHEGNPLVEQIIFQHPLDRLPRPLQTCAAFSFRLHPSCASSVARRLHEVHLGHLGQRRHFVGIADSADARQLNDSYKSSALIITQYYPILPNITQWPNIGLILVPILAY